MTRNELYDEWSLYNVYRVGRVKTTLLALKVLSVYRCLLLERYGYVA